MHENITPGDIYEHYKGNRYRIVGVGLHSDTHEKMVVYQGLYDSEEFGPQPLWIRPYDVFMNTVTVEGADKPRFKFVQGNGVNMDTQINMSEKYYRVTVDGMGIYAVVDRDCPKDDPRRNGKPDGSWLAKKGLDFPGAISYWTGEGWQRYQESGLYDWHRSVVSGDVRVEEVERPTPVVYEDNYQIIVGR